MLEKRKVLENIAFMLIYLTKRGATPGMSMPDMVM
jgi:hypothetical protein